MGNQATKQRVIQSFHVANKKLRLAEKQGDKEEVQKLSQSIKDSGGLARYQAASLRGRNGTVPDPKLKKSGGKDAKSRGEKRREEELGIEVGSSVFSSAVWVVQELEHGGFLNSTRGGGALKAQRGEEEAQEEGTRKRKTAERGEGEGEEQSRKKEEQEGAGGKEHGGEKLVRLLDVGSIVNAYKGRHPRIAPVCIDPAPKDPSVLKFDLLSYFAHWKRKKAEPFECLVLAMMLNFEPDPNRRGEMLSAAAAMLAKGGLLLLSLPKACLTNSRYLDAKGLRALGRKVGLRVRRIKLTSKLALCSFSKRSHTAPPSSSSSSATTTSSNADASARLAPAASASAAASTDKKKAQRETNGRVIRTGKGRNNFRIALPPSHTA